MHTVNEWFKPCASFQRLFSAIETQFSVSEKNPQVWKREITLENICENIHLLEIWLLFVQDVVDAPYMSLWLLRWNLTISVCASPSFNLWHLCLFSVFVVVLGACLGIAGIGSWNCWGTNSPCPLSPALNQCNNRSWCITTLPSLRWDNPAVYFYKDLQSPQRD